MGRSARTAVSEGLHDGLQRDGGLARAGRRHSEQIAAGLHDDREGANLEVVDWRTGKAMAHGGRGGSHIKIRTFLGNKVTWHSHIWVPEGPDREI